MHKICIIDKRKVRLIYILLFSFVIGTFLSVFWNVLLIPSVISYSFSLYVQFKYIVCSNCDFRIFLTDLSFSGDSKYCKNCGYKIQCK